MVRFSVYSLALLFAFSLLAFAPAALAVDGVALIDQSTSVNGLPGCPHAGFPIEICAPGSYRLSGNLTVSSINTGAVWIKVPNVTLDLNGFAILGPVQCAAGTYPVQCSDHGTGIGIFASTSNITVRDGTIQGLGAEGIHLDGAGNIIDDLHVDSSGAIFGAGIVVGGASVIIHCTATTNAGSGILDQRGLVHDTIISFNTTSRNGGFGIYGGGTVSNNNASFNGQDGIHNAALAVHNTMIGNIGFGISTDFGANGYLGNVIRDSGWGPVHGGNSMGQNLCNGVAC
jgi:hypothetical protein